LQTLCVDQFPFSDVEVLHLKAFMALRAIILSNDAKLSLEGDKFLHEQAKEKGWQLLLPLGKTDIESLFKRHSLYLVDSFLNT
jgi:hypothetical protein